MHEWLHHSCASDDPRGRLPSAPDWRRLARCKQTLARCARQPRPNFSDTHHPKNLNAVSDKSKTGLPPDRRLCTDGFIIRAQAMIRADGFRPRQIGEGIRASFAKACALRAPTHVAPVFAPAARGQPRPIDTDAAHPYQLDAVSDKSKNHLQSASGNGRDVLCGPRLRILRCSAPRYSEISTSCPWPGRQS